MKLSFKYLFLISAIAVASHSSLVVADDEAVSTSESVPVESDAAAEGAAADDSGGPVTEEAEVSVKSDDGDAGKECIAEECASKEEAEPEAANPADKVEEVAAKEEEKEDPGCPSRPHVIRCAAKYLDTNKNGALERSELEEVMNGVPWLLRSLLRIIGSVDSIMKKCDADGDGAITIENDMEATKDTCLATCFKRNAFKKLFFPECTE